MKRLIAICMLIIGLVMCIIAPLLAQTLPNTTELPPVDQWFGSLESVFSALVVIGGYLSHKIPGLANISNATYRVAAFALLVGVGFWFYGADIWGLAISYFLSTSMYELILKPAGLKSPRTESRK